MFVRALSTGLAVNRIAFGLGYLLKPAPAGRGWIGRIARHPGTAVFTRALGARDVALGLGALRALWAGGEGEARAWMAAHALSDGADLAATLAARRPLPRKGVRFASAMAGASTAVAALGATAPSLAASPAGCDAWAGQPPQPVRRADGDRPGVELEERAAVAAHDARVVRDGDDVERRGVVGVQRGALVRGRAGGVEEPGGAEDGVARVVHVAAVPVRAPARGDELHRPLRAGRRVVAQPAEARLHEVHRRQQRPPDVRAPRRLAVVREQPPGRLGRPGTEAARVGRRVQARQRALRRAEVADLRPQPAAEARQHPAGESRLGREPLLEALEAPREHRDRLRTRAVRPARPPAAPAGPP